MLALPHMSEIPVQLIDSHAHLDGPDFDEDRDAVFERARDAGVVEIVVVGAGGDMETVERTVALAEQREGVHATVGVHPHDAGKLDDAWWPRLRELAARDDVVAVGETGLDSYYDHSEHDVQRRRFREFVELARDVDKPVICHIRDAHDDAKTILRETRAAELGAVIHCFTGTPEDARDYAAMGCYVSFSGIVTFKGVSAEPIRQAVREVPLDRVLVETDCPYLAPVPNRGKRNEPAYVVHTAEVVAREAGIELVDFAAKTVANTRRFFRLTPD
jgi:TatD DNase family protein